MELRKTEKDQEKYLDDPKFSLSDSELLFKLRTRMISVKTNFPSMWNKDVSCRTCNLTVEIESQEHVLRCSGIRQTIDINDGTKYSDIFSHPDKQLYIVRCYRKILSQQEIMLNASD